ncbi:MAG: hypothetical protein L6245_02625, partial [Thermodesulfovibrionales bacterium]|nr:hypothetical protein [Thermodesulfovibrionales bacterium]
VNMGRIVLEVSNEELLQLGEEKIKEEIERSLKFLKIKGLLKDISSAIRGLKIDYEKETEDIKKESWQEYKKGISL